MEHKMILEGIRVIDWSLMQAAPMAAAMLADLGAEVIHVEERGVGDGLRGIISTFGIPCLYPDGRHINFEEHNRNKKSLAIDLKKPQGREIIHKLVKSSDVFITNFRPTAAKRLSLDYDTLTKYNPKLIYALSTGLGRYGPDSNNPSLDGVAQARSGAFMSAPGPDMSPTGGIPSAGDRGTSILLAFSIMSALFGRERTGIGQQVHVSQLGTMIFLQGYHVMLTLASGQNPPVKDRKNLYNPAYNSYKCKDGAWLFLAGFRVDEWQKICKVVVPDLVDNPRFATFEKRAQNSRELISLIEQSLLTKTRGEWLQLLKEADVRAAPINTFTDLESDPQVIANNYIIEWDRPGLGPIKFVGLPYDFDKTPATLRSPAPELGQHTEEILTDICGYSWEEVAQFRNYEVI